MENSRERSRARTTSGSHTATTRTRSLKFRQATRWNQLIIPAPAMATLRGLRYGIVEVLRSRLRRDDRPGGDGIEEMDGIRVQRDLEPVATAATGVAAHARDQLRVRGIEREHEQGLGAERLDGDDAH